MCSYLPNAVDYYLSAKRKPLSFPTMLPISTQTHSNNLCWYRFWVIYRRKAYQRWDDDDEIMRKYTCRKSKRTKHVILFFWLFELNQHDNVHFPRTRVVLRKQLSLSQLLQHRCYRVMTVFHATVENILCEKWKTRKLSPFAEMTISLVHVD